MKVVLSRASHLIPFVFFFFEFLSLPVKAQVRCGTVEYDQQRHGKNGAITRTDAFEKWMKGQIAKKAASGTLGREQAASYTIPVVVHILHNGEAVGAGTNISDAQVISQIAALNRDYPRHNADSVNTPAEFASSAGKINMTFVLAKQDPEGVPTNGITRTHAPKTSYAYADDSEFKALSYWPAEEYLNIWVLNFVDPNSIIAYAELPVQSSLPGLETAVDDRLIDGVAVLYSVFGDESGGQNFGLNSHYNKGRTLVHEIGHIFGLRHIWGDVTNCNGTDYCDDTPTQNGATYGCPTHPSIACTHDKMFQNYMDYTDDACYNLFTQDQVDRMVVVLANSPRRLSLLSSKGAFDPTIPALDLGARAILNPETTACKGVAIVPTLQVRNYGSTKITAAQIQVSVNGSVQETKAFSLSLNYLDTVNLDFSAITFTASSTLQFTITTVNGVSDNVSSNNVISEQVSLPASVPIPFIQTFDSLPADWTIQNPDNGITWAIKTAPASSLTNRAIYMDFYNYDTRSQQDKLITPVFDLSSADVATLKFDRSYALYQSANSDRLRVIISPTCDSKNSIELFNAAGADLATVTKHTDEFVPQTAADWKTESISLTPYLGNSNLQVSFIATNQNGNDLYLDNVSVTSGTYFDLAIIGLESPDPITCISNPQPKLRVVNLGSVPIHGFKIVSNFNSVSTNTQEFSDIDLAVGQDTLVSLAAWALSDGVNVIKITLSDDNTDIAPANNVLTLNEALNTSTAAIPLRQNFNATYDDWTLVSPTGATNWKPIANLTKVMSLYYKGFGNTALGSEAWLATPVLDFSNTQTAAVFFDLSYAAPLTGNDRLQLLASTNCGETYDISLYDEQSSALGTHRDASGNNILASSAWNPQSDDDWRREDVNLDQVAGRSDVRLAWVFTNGDGNNLFLDNIEFFVSDTPPLAIPPTYAVYNNNTTSVKVTFNFPEATSVQLQVLNMMGLIIVDNQFDQVLNQTYTIDLSGSQSGLYIVRLKMGDKLGTAKVLINK